MNRRRRWAWLGGIIACLLFLQTWSAAAGLPPSPSPRYVQDEAGWLGAHAFTALDLKLEQFERETSSQLVVGIYPRLPDGEDLFDYSQRIFNAWKPGQQGKDNGVLLLIFDADRKLRIHSGYGLEGALPDARANQIIRDVIVPRIRAGDREAAVTGGAGAIMAAVKGEYTGDGRTNLDQDAPEGAIWPLLLIVGFILLGFRFPVLFSVIDVMFSAGGATSSSGGGRSWGGGGSSSSGGGFSGGGGRSGGGGASGGW